MIIILRQKEGLLLQLHFMCALGVVIKNTKNDMNQDFHNYFVLI